MLPTETKTRSLPILKDTSSLPLHPLPPNRIFQLFNGFACLERKGKEGERIEIRVREKYIFLGPWSHNVSARGVTRATRPNLACLPRKSGGWLTGSDVGRKW